jgi:anaerobic magnesium-protoporphyrin IX monomethyl ester cyclase
MAAPNEPELEAGGAAPGERMALRVLFVYSDISGAEYYGAKKYYSGLGSLSAVLKAAGHDTALLYLQRQLSAEAFVAQVDAQAPDLVAFSSTTHQYPYIESYARDLKAAQPALLTVCGGTHPTLVPEAVVRSPGFDLVCVGEGEHPLRDLAERLERGQDYAEIPNLWFQRGDQTVRNPLRPLVTDLDELPYADRELFNFEAMLAANDGWVDVMSGRGCPYNCSYCCNHALRQQYAGLGRYVRFRSPGHIMGELRALRERYAVNTINFQDDIFTLNPQWTLDFCRAYEAEFDWPFWINSRVEQILDEKVVAALAGAHCLGIRIGIENGTQALRETVLRRTMSNEEIIAAVRLVKRYGLKIYTTNMIGVPGETTETIQSTIDLNRELAPDEFQFSVFYPYPMTALYDTCVAQNLIKPGAELTSYYSKESVLHLPTLTDDELGRGYERFEALSAELALKRASPAKYRLYLLLLKLYRGDSPRLVRRLDRLRRWKRRLAGLIPSRSAEHAAPPKRPGREKAGGEG